MVTEDGEMVALETSVDTSDTTMPPAGAACDNVTGNAADTPTLTV